MQTASVNLQAELDKGQTDPIVLVDLYELYEPDYVPGVDGFDPVDATEAFAGQEITWAGNAYRREVISRGDIVRNMGEKTNQVTLSFSNISRYLATLAQTQTIEGMFLVIRCVSPTVTDDSLTLFVGRCDKPSDIDKKTFTLTARQDFGNINQEIPPRSFTAEDPNGRTPSDPLYEGFRITALSGSLQFPVQVPSTSFFGRLFGKTKTEWRTKQWSSLDSTPYGSPVPMIFGRCQMLLIPIFFADLGAPLIGVWVVGEGRVDSFTDITIRDRRFTKVTEDFHYGDPGGTGTNATNMSSVNGPINQGYLSKTAYTILSMLGSTVEQEDDAPDVTALVRGTRVPVPNSSGVFDSEKWTDNPAYITRFVLTDPRLVGINPGFMEDSVVYQTGQHCDEALIDDSNGEMTLISTTDQPSAGERIRRYRSTGVLTPRHYRYHYLGDTSIIPEEEENDYTPVDISDIPTVFAPVRVLRKRYTVNVPITDRMRAVDFLYKVIFSAAKIFLRINKRGKYEPRSEKSSDSTRLRSASVVGATSIPILDVTPWKAGPDLLTGRLLLGFGLTTSEIRDVSSADYSTSGNSIPLVASVTGGGVTATASGATLSGGSVSAQATGTVTIGGTPGAGNTATVTIDGIASVHTLNSDDTTGTVAAMLSALINANPKLNKYIQAVWSSAAPTVITIKCKHGALNFSSAFLKAHVGPIADPSSNPTYTAASGGSLAAGTWQIGYSDVTAVGKTALSPIASVAVTLNQKIAVTSQPAFPAGVTQRNFYMSDAADSANLRFLTSVLNNSNFDITQGPLTESALPPGYNTTAEELIRVAMSFATNSQDVYPVWPVSTAVILNDVYLPTTPNGHKYQVTTAGTTGATEPSWPTSAGGTVASGTAVFTEIGSTVLQQAGLTRANIVKDTYKWPLGSRQSSVNQIKGHYIDSNNDFVRTPFSVRDPVHYAQVNKWYPMEVDLSAVDNSHQMIRIANWMLAKHREGDWFNTLTTGPRGLVLEEGDVICASDDSGGLINQVTRIEELRIHPNHDVTIAQARKYSTLMFADEVGADVIPIPTTLRYTQTVDSLIEFIDNFPIRDADGLVVGFYVVVSRDINISGDWKGWALYADYGDGYTQIAEGDIAGVIGEATTTLASFATPSMLDTINSLTFTLTTGDSPSAPFSSVADIDELYANPRRNLFIYGDEYLQAATITDNGNSSYTLSGGLLRARFGTINKMAHSAGERVVYLNGAEVVVAIDPVRLATPYDYKIVTTNQDVADAVAQSFTWDGGTALPPPPDRMEGLRNSDNDLYISVTERSRVGLGLRPFSDVPLGEEKAEYEFEVFNGSNIVNTWRAYLNESEIPLWEVINDGKSLVTIDSQGSVTISNIGLGGNDVVLLAKQPLRAVEDTLISFSCNSTTRDMPTYVGLVPESLIGTELDGVDPPFGWLNYAALLMITPVPDPGVVEVAALDEIRLTIRMQGNRVTYYQNRTDDSSPILHVATAHPVGAYRLFIAQVLPNSSVRHVLRPGIRRLRPTTIYTAAQQTADGLTPGNPVKMRVRKISAIVGRGDYLEQTI